MSGVLNKQSLASVLNKQHGTLLSNKGDLEKMKEALPPGALRFAPSKPERDIEEQLNDLAPSQRETFENLMDRWDERYRPQVMPDDVLLRFLRNSQFDEKATWKVMRKFPKRYLTALKAKNFENQLLSKVRAI